MTEHPQELWGGYPLVGVPSGPGPPGPAPRFKIKRWTSATSRRGRRQRTSESAPRFMQYSEFGKS